MSNYVNRVKQANINKPSRSTIALARRALRPSMVAFAVAQAISAPVMAATITVNDNGDTGSAETCTLRQAVKSANDNAAGTSNCIAGNGTDTITFSNSVIDSGSISLNTPTLLISDDLVINATGDSNLEIDAMGGSGIFSIFLESTVSLNNLKLTGTASGSPIAISGDSDVVLNNSTVTGNGRHIRITSGSLIINDSTVSDNISPDSGGGIYVRSSSSLHLINSTVSGNSTTARGGAIYANDGIINISNSTITDNTANSLGGGLALTNSTVNISNNIIAGNLSNLITRSHEIINVNESSTINSSHNILGDSRYANGPAFDNFTPDGTDITATSDGTLPTALLAIIAPLADNGGVTQTHALVEGSPALSAADGMLCTAVPVNSEDQRGLPRNTVCDIGAFEAQTSVTITVGNTLDATGSCSLRDAISSSNSDTAIGGCVAGNNDEQIVFDPAVFPGATPATILLNSALPSITSNMTITGPSPSGLSINGNNTVGSVLTLSGATVGLNNLTITGGSAVLGGGLYVYQSNLSLNNSTVSDNSANYGGGIYADESNVSLYNSTLSGNSANYGGAIYTRDHSKLSLNESTVSGNTATGDGGGVYTFFRVSVGLSNSTLSNNTATMHGGGIHARRLSVITINNSTLSGNSAASGGGISARENSTVSLGNSIVAGNLAPVDAELFDMPGYGTNIFTTRHSLLGDSSNNNDGAFFADFTPDGTDITATLGSPQETDLSSILAPLANNGGATKTHALAAGSPAIDAGDDAECAAAPINNLDQRGEERPVGNACDIGSYEFSDDPSIFVIPLPGGKSVIFSL